MGILLACVKLVAFYSFRNARIINNMRAMELITNGSLTVNGAICYNSKIKLDDLYSASACSR